MLLSYDSHPGVSAFHNLRCNEDFTTASHHKCDFLPTLIQHKATLFMFLHCRSKSKSYLNWSNSKYR